MSTAAVTLHGFAYGEHVDALSGRSFGFRLLTPPAPHPWTAEVETLARGLQAAPFPDHWTPAELFCSVLLRDDRRLIALARYGLADHTATQRRGGLELVGVVGPAALDANTALAIYHWLRRRRAATEDLHAFGDTCDLSDAVSATDVPPLPSEPMPVLPIRLGQEGVLLFAATASAEPDHHLGLLQRTAVPGWQWLPLVGADFPLQTYTARGPLIAWTPQLTGVALKLDRAPDGGVAVHPDRWNRISTLATPILLVVLLVLLLANLWTSLAVLRRQEERALPRAEPPPAVQPIATSSAEPFAAALHDLVQARSSAKEWEPLQKQLLLQYERVVSAHTQLHVEPGNTRGKLAVAMVDLLTRRSDSRLQEAVRKALVNRGYDANVIQAACEAIQRQITAGDLGAD